MRIRFSKNFDGDAKKRLHHHNNAHPETDQLTFSNAHWDMSYSMGHKKMIKQKTEYRF